MKIENITRAHNIAGELAVFRRNIDLMKKWIKDHPKGAGYSIQEYSDGSGSFEINTMFKKGDYNEDLYKELADTTLSILEKHYKVLLVEIEEL